MKLRIFALGFGLGLATALLTANALSGAGPAEDDENARRWKKYTLPSAHHRMLEVFEGEWDVTMKIWMAGPDKPPAISKSTAKSKLIFGGRFIQTRMVGTINIEVDGKMMEFPVDALGYIGYDNFKEKFVTIWIDSHSTAIYYSEGTADKVGEVFTYLSISDAWDSGERDKPMMMVDRVVSEDRIVTEMYDMTGGPGGERIWEMTANRKKPVR